VVRISEVLLTLTLLSVDCASVAEEERVLEGDALEVLDGMLKPLLVLVLVEEIGVGCEVGVGLASWLDVVDGGEDDDVEEDQLDVVGVIMGTDDVEVASGVLVGMVCV
jgi:hypothetical protein